MKKITIGELGTKNKIYLVIHTPDEETNLKNLRIISDKETIYPYTFAKKFGGYDTEKYKEFLKIKSIPEFYDFLKREGYIEESKVLLFEYIKYGKAVYE